MVVPFRISVTDLDSWDIYKNFDWLDTPAFVRRLCRLEPKTMNMYAGQAVHEHLENLAQNIKKDMILAGDVFYRVEDQHMAKRVELPIPDEIEVKSEMELEVCGRPIELVGIIDAGVHSLGRLVEHKTTGTIKLENYMNAWQWRAYLFMRPEYWGVDYHVWKVKAKYSTDTDSRIFILDHMSLGVNRYKDMNRDVMDKLAEYVNGLETMLQFGWIEREGKKFRPGNRYHDSL